MKKSELKEIIREEYLKFIGLHEEDEEKEEKEDTQDDGDTSEAQEAAPKETITFEGRELDMLVDVNKNPTKKGLKVQFLSNTPFTTEERTKLVSSLQSYLDEGLGEYVKGININIDSDQDVPNKSTTIGYTVKIGDLFDLFSKVFQNKASQEESPLEDAE
jgi:hypothetical protein